MISNSNANYELILAVASLAFSFSVVSIYTCIIEVHSDGIYVDLHGKSQHRYFFGEGISVLDKFYSVCVTLDIDNDEQQCYADGRPLPLLVRNTRTLSWTFLLNM